LDQALQAGLGGLLAGFEALALDPRNVVMIAVGCVLIWLGVARDLEPLLLLPIGFGAIIVNIPGAGLMEPGGVLRTIYDFGVQTELFPILIFIGIGAMTDFGPLLENPRILLLGAAGQFGIFLTLMLALALGFPPLHAISIGVIGAMDGPTAIYVTTKYAPELLGAVSVAAYSYMSLVPLIQPPIMRLLTTRDEKTIVMPPVRASASKRVRILFPIVVVIVGSLIAPQGTPLLATVMLGNLMRESGVVERLTQAAANEITNVVTLLLGISIGATMQAGAFLTVQTFIILALGFIAICLDTACGVLFGKVMCTLSGGKINPLIGAAGISAYPMAARVVQVEGQKYNRRNYLLMHAMGANTGGQIGSIMAASIMLSVIAGLHVA
jgi:sodium ion-translocating decarboxylase beta subunit